MSSRKNMGMPRRVPWKGDWPVRDDAGARVFDKKVDREAGEILWDVRKYDAVLRWHCRLDERPPR